MKDSIQMLRVLLLSVVAGFAIGIGGVVYLSVDNKIAGALMFTVALYTICVHGLNLFTGKVGYLPIHTMAYLLDLEVIWIGNLIGTMAAAWLVLHTRGKVIGETAKAMCKVKMDDSYTSLFILGIFCGFLMYVAVEGFAKTKNPIILFMGVATFILSGFEHCIADMFYFSVGSAWTPDAFLRVLVITLGNTLGGILLQIVKKLGEDIPAGEKSKIVK